MSPIGQAPPTVVLMPSVGQAVGKAKGAPSEVATQPATEVMSMPTSERAELSATPIDEGGGDGGYNGWVIA